MNEVIDNDSEHSCKTLLSHKGPFSKDLKHFVPREEQQLLADEIAQSIRDKSVLIAEAGTGTGKTFAYLVPAIVSQKKILISTGTKNLQDQLFHRDIPTVLKALKIPRRVALLKGRNNYLCHYRIESNEHEILLTSKKQVQEFADVKSLLESTVQGDISELDNIAENSPLWSMVTSTAENCLNKECPYLKDCFLMKARRKALEADIVVINHHLFFADLTLKQEGFGELLPEVETIILDEAHQLPKVASQFLGENLSSRQMSLLMGDIVKEQKESAKDMPRLADEALSIDKLLLVLREQLGDGEDKRSWEAPQSNTELFQLIEDIKQAFSDLNDLLALASGRSKILENCYERSQECAVQFHRLTGKSPEGFVHWIETFSRSFRIHLTPLLVDSFFEKQITGKERAWIFTSATLSVAGQFHHFSNTLGIKEAREVCFDSPFDYKQQALLYIPRGLPDPNSNQYLETMLDAAIPVINACEGRTFFLFTSHRMLQWAAEQLRLELSYPLFIQGEAPKDKLLQRFRQSGNGVLLGTASFWEGVDVQGEALSCVIIDKLPFESPGDPVAEARSKALRRGGKDPFSQEQLPKAVIQLKQGAGRLIRGKEDRGILMICDPRLGAKDYGKLFLSSLPPMSRTRDLAVVEAFMNNYS